MRAKRSDGKIVRLRFGEAVCGYGFFWVVIEPRDKKFIYSPSKAERKMAAKWLDHILGQRLMEKPKKEK